jgi:hypothetical protein
MDVIEISSSMRYMPGRLVASLPLSSRCSSDFNCLYTACPGRAAIGSGTSKHAPGPANPELNSHGCSGDDVHVPASHMMQGGHDQLHSPMQQVGPQFSVLPYSASVHASASFRLLTLPGGRCSASAAAVQGASAITRAAAHQARCRSRREGLAAGTPRLAMHP